MKARNHPRESTCHDGEARLGDDLFVGSVLDLSPGGAFFRPEAGLIDNCFTQLHRNLEGLSVGSIFEFTVHANDEVPVLTVATVRWKGHSSLHGCTGVGLQFSSTAFGV
ncbi:MAG: PilZ domain-containing protein [Myxococcota bacterium]